MGIIVQPRFELGLVVMTPGVEELVAAGIVNPTPLLHRHVAGDWGDLDPEDRASNARALIHGDRLLSSYDVAEGVRVWLITEAADDNGYRQATTLLLPDEY